MSQMKVVRFFPPGGTEKLQVLNEPVPTELKPNEVLIKVRAVGLIWPELTWPIYKRPDGSYYDHIPGHDFSGVVTDIGAEARKAGMEVGSEVWAFTSRRNHEGAMAEYAIADMDQVMPKPTNLDFAEAASIPLSALTAWQALFEHWNLRAGQRLLVTGAAGGTGVFAVQFARHVGAHVIGTGSSARSRQLLEQLGVDEFVDYKTQDLKTTVGEVDLVLDCVGGKTLDAAYSVVKKDGLLISIVDYDTKELAAQKGVNGLFFIVSMNKEQLSKIKDLIEDGKVKTTVDQKFPLDNAKHAFEEAGLGHVHGKVVIEV